MFFLKKAPILGVLSIPTIWVAFYDNCASIWWNKFHVQKREQICRRDVNAIGKHGVRKNVPFEKKILLSYSKEYGVK